MKTFACIAFYLGALGLVGTWDYEAEQELVSFVGERTPNYYANSQDILVAKK